LFTSQTANYPIRKFASLPNSEPIHGKGIQRYLYRLTHLKSYSFELLYFIFLTKISLHQINFFPKLNKKVEIMGTTKIYPYSDQTLQLAQIAKAMGHPARITILKYLFENDKATNDTFRSITTLNKSTISKHIKELISANLVYSDYREFEGNYYLKQEASLLIEMLVQEINQ
jgi:ArsR family transcriptional regulator, arsenate/arsenite/antimonite-responsive transcriptional repressor